MPSMETIENEALWDVEQLLQQQGRSLSQYPGMPIPTKPTDNVASNKALELEYEHMKDPDKLKELVAADLILCNEQQRLVFDELHSAIDLPDTVSKCYFLYASGGCGKTFLLNLILRHFRSLGHISKKIFSFLYIFLLSV